MSNSSSPDTNDTKSVVETIDFALGAMSSVTLMLLIPFVAFFFTHAKNIEPLLGILGIVLTVIDLMFLGLLIVQVNKLKKCI